LIADRDKPAHAATVKIEHRGEAMKTSQDRILTTHVGSLPRPPELRQMLVRKDQGEPFDQGELDRVVRQAVLDIVRRQAAVGVDIVNDGEMSKPGYSTYIADRLSGFAGHQPAKPRLDTKDHPNFLAALERMTGANIARRAVCVGPIAWRDREPLHQDLANLRAALDQVSAVEGFMTAASPGLVPVFQTNSYYPTHEAYVEAIAAAMQEEYEAIVKAGFVLQLDCPDLAMAHHTSFQDLDEADFLKRAAFHVEVLNHALRNVPADRARIHICWGNYEGPHDHDIPFAKVAPILVKAKPMALVVEAANPRHAHEWAVWQDIKLPDDKILIPGVLDTSTNYVEHPDLVAERICRFADIVGRERVIAGSDCGFGTFAGYGKLDPDISFKKLAAMAQGAAIASKRLWRG
jgi:5-methyltetrahydropteroyltriglutamate--homocysteine methyltransferase